MAANIKQVGLIYTIRPLLIGLLLVILALYAFQFLLKDRRKTGLAVSLFMILFYSYGHVHGILHEQASGILTKNQTTGAIWLILIAFGLWFIAKKIKQPDLWTRAMNAISILLTGFSLAQVITYEVRYNLSLRQQQASSDHSITNELGLQGGQTSPDIYYIILDTYTRADALEQEFNYDNYAFLADLRARGFFVGTCSQSNYPSTAASLTSSLNFAYLDQIDPRLSDTADDPSQLVPYLTNNTVFQALKELGYQIVSIETGYSPTDFHNADQFFSSRTDVQSTPLFGGLTAFEAMFFHTSGLNYLYETRLFPIKWRNSLFNNAYLLHRNRILYAFDKLASIPSLPGPKLVFIHILAPHNPFVFGPNGELLQRNTPFTLNYDRDSMQLN